MNYMKSMKSGHNKMILKLEKGVEQAKKILLHWFKCTEGIQICLFEENCQTKKGDRKHACIACKVIKLL